MPTLAEISDKVATVPGCFVLLFVFGLAWGGLIGFAWRFSKLGAGAFALLSAAVLAGLGLAPYFLWNVVDHDLREQALHELGAAWFWKCRLAAWAGLAVGVALGFVTTSRPVKPRPPTGPREQSPA